GFLKAYVEGSDDPEGALDNREVRLPALKVGDSVQCHQLKASDHETKPPARYTEASLVQTMEKEGIGRPSTYASIIGTIQDRGYVRKMGNALVPTFTALVVSKLLKEHLPDYVDLAFTSEMEKSLDDIAQGDLDQLKYLKSIYFGNKGLKSQVETQEKEIDGEESRQIRLDGLKNLIFKVGRYGAYVCRSENNEEVCASLPDNQIPADITQEQANKLIDQKVNGTDALGKDPETDLPVYVLTGRYGPYVQLGESEVENKETKPKRMAIPAGIEMESVTLPMALKLLELPKTLGTHPDSGKDIKKGLGRFGPYVVHDGDFRSIPKTDDLFLVDLKRALELLAQPKKVRGRSQVMKELGEHPVSKEAIQVLNGKYGPYIKFGKKNISLPEDVKVEDFDLKAAVALIDDKVGTVEASEGKTAKKKTAKKKTAAKKISKTSKAAKVSTEADTKPAPRKTVLKKADSSRSSNTSR
ncbi:MAG: DNA topoisomerase I, partial [Bdellovibrionales bacterium]|nr:DNA topoisomerase I [Bdellovibrionales bacterium]